jgi:putative transposase
LKTTSFAGLRHARQLIAAWRDDYYHHRPHASLDGLTPGKYFNRSEKDQTRDRLEERLKNLPALA